jgi:glycine amidinotransferase
MRSALDEEVEQEPARASIPDIKIVPSFDPRPLHEIYPKEGIRSEDLPNLNKEIKVNAWTQWGDIDTIMVGQANHACFPPSSPGFRPEINDPHLASWLTWPEGRKKDDVIERANIELDNLAKVLEEHQITVLRPGNLDWYGGLKTPFFDVPNQYTHTCVRDSLITMGNIVMEAAMSRRDRYFENLAFRDVIRHLWDHDKDMLWKSAPRPTLGEDSYNDGWWNQTDEERYSNMHDYKFCITEKDVLFDAADIMRAGKDIFVQLSMTCNKAGIEWLTRELRPHGIRVHTVRFPYDLAPSHLDCTFQLLRPGLVLTNPDRPIAEEDSKIFKDNGWEFVDCPQPNNPERPPFSQSSKWLSMNILPLGRNKIVVEEQEVNTQNTLTNLGFEVITVPFRNVYEFGGSLHCATWDIARTDKMEDFFPVQ